MILFETRIEELDEVIMDLRQERRRLLHTHECHICKEAFVVRGSGKPAKYCSGACKAKAYRLRKKAALS